jgi:squalene-hopene/tetraprenyl-beta-curcumene cyclase
LQGQSIDHAFSSMVAMTEDRYDGLEDDQGSAWCDAAVKRSTRATPPGDSDLDRLVAEVAGALEAEQRPDGHWCYELEADATIPAEYVLLGHFLGEVDQALDEKIGVYLRARQMDHGGWPLFPGGDFNISASVKAYYALKLIGDDPEAPHMMRARTAILAHGGAARCNVFTRITLALFGQVPWRAVPVMPAEIMLLPRWFPFHMDKVSYWSRTVIAPLLIIMAKKPTARNPRGVGIGELFATPSDRERRYNVNPTGSTFGNLFLGLDQVLQRVEPFFPRFLRERALDAALAFIRARLNGEEGLGGIFPAMANAVIALELMGFAKDHPDVLTAKRALRRLLVIEQDQAYCQPCLSPVWDTALACHAMLEVADRGRSEPARRALDWLAERQITDVVGDWAVGAAPGTKPGGWAFEYANDHYPDVDDTAAVICAMQRADPERYRAPIRRALDWILGMQSRNGGWGAFDVDNTHYYLNSIPFADHGALLDPPTADVTARCLGALAATGHGRDHPAVARAIAFLEREQEPDGSWFGRWGTNYIYGTWSVLSALNAAGEAHDGPCFRRAVEWLVARQQADGGWGESCASYWSERRHEQVASTPTHTAWALLGLMAAGEADHPAVRRGIAFLQAAPREGGQWQETLYNAVGFPRVFYLHYHGYPAYFPLWALARYANLTRRNASRLPYGM